MRSGCEQERTRVDAIKDLESRSQLMTNHKCARSHDSSDIESCLWRHISLPFH